MLIVQSRPTKMTECLICYEDEFPETSHPFAQIDYRNGELYGMGNSLRKTTCCSSNICANCIANIAWNSGDRCPYRCARGNVWRPELFPNPNPTGRRGWQLETDGTPPRRVRRCGRCGGTDHISTNRRCPDRIRRERERAMAVLEARQNAAPPLSVALRGMDERLAANAPVPVPDPAPTPDDAPAPAPAPATVPVPPPTSRERHLRAVLEGSTPPLPLPLTRREEGLAEENVRFMAEVRRHEAENARLRAEVTRLQGVVVGQQQRIANITAYLTE